MRKLLLLVVLAAALPACGDDIPAQPDGGAPTAAALQCSRFDSFGHCAAFRPDPITGYCGLAFGTTCTPAATVSVICTGPGLTGYCSYVAPWSGSPNLQLTGWDSFAFRIGSVLTGASSTLQVWFQPGQVGPTVPIPPARWLDIPATVTVRSLQAFGS